MTDPQPWFRPDPLVPEEVSHAVRRILAPNPSPMTYRGTNSYLVGHTEIAVIDPGPMDERHLDALLAALLPEQRITAICVTHAHLDHSPLARPLSERTGAPVYAFGDATAGRSEIMTRLASNGQLGGGEGVDAAFQPDRILKHGDTVTGEGWCLTALHTPGHFGNHVCFALDDRLFSGDLVMGWATSLVSPPDGDLTAFMASLRQLASGAWRVFYPGHGAPVDDPLARIEGLLAHRMSREAQICAALETAPSDAAHLARHIYTDTPQALLPAAERNVLAHLLDLLGKSRVTALGPLTADVIFALR